MINQGQDLSINMDGEAVEALLWCQKGAAHHLVTEFNEAPAQMKKDGSLEQIIQKWTASQLRQAQRQLLLLDKWLPSERAHYCQ